MHTGSATGAHERELIVNTLGGGSTLDVLAQLRGQDSGSGLDFSQFLPLLAGILASAVFIVAVWRAFKSYMSDGAKGADVNPEETTKKQSNIAIQAGIVIGFITLGAVVIGFIVGLFQRFIG